MPKRIQRKRTKGWHKPEGAIYVGRGSKWGNPFQVGKRFANAALYVGVFNPTIEMVREFLDKDGFIIKDVQMALRLYRRYLRWRKLDVNELHGKDLMCWCNLDKPCHADILIEAANPKTKNNPFDGPKPFRATMDELPLYRDPYPGNLPNNKSYTIKGRWWISEYPAENGNGE